MRSHRLALIPFFALIAMLGGPLAWIRPAAAVHVWHTPKTGPNAISDDTSCNASDVYDSTIAFNNWLVNVQKQAVGGDIIQLDAGMCYWVDGSIKFGGFRPTSGVITFDGNGATIQSFNDIIEPDLPHLLIQGDSNVVVKNLNIVGNGGSYYDALSFQAAYKVYGGNHITLTNDTANTVFGDYVDIQADSGTVPDTINITNNTFGAAGSGTFGAGRQELSIDDGTNVTVTGNYFGHGSRSAIDIEPPGNGDWVDTVLIQSNTFGPVHNFWLANEGGDSHINKVTIDSNVLQGQPMNVESRNPGFGDATILRTNYAITNNTATTATQSCGGQGLGQSAEMFIAGVHTWYTYDPNTGKYDIKHQAIEGPGVNGLTISGNHQDMTDCSEYLYGSHLNNVKVLNNILPNATTVALYNQASADASTNVCEKGNYIGPNASQPADYRQDPPATQNC